MHSSSEPEPEPEPFDDSILLLSPLDGTNAQDISLLEDVRAPFDLGAAGLLETPRPVTRRKEVRSGWRSIGEDEDVELSPALVKDSASKQAQGDHAVDGDEGNTLEPDTIQPTSLPQSRIQKPVYSSAPQTPSYPTQKQKVSRPAQKITHETFTIIPVRPPISTSLKSFPIGPTPRTDPLPPAREVPKPDPTSKIHRAPITSSRKPVSQEPSRHATQDRQSAKRPKPTFATPTRAPKSENSPQATMLRNGSLQKLLSSYSSSLASPYSHPSASADPPNPPTSVIRRSMGGVSAGRTAAGRGQVQGSDWEHQEERSRSSHLNERKEVEGGYLADSPDTTSGAVTTEKEIACSSLGSLVRELTRDGKQSDSCALDASTTNSEDHETILEETRRTSTSTTPTIEQMPSPDLPSDSKPAVEDEPAPSSMDRSTSEQAPQTPSEHSDSDSSAYFRGTLQDFPQSAPIVSERDSTDVMPSCIAEDSYSSVHTPTRGRCDTENVPGDEGGERFGEDWSAKIGTENSEGSGTFDSGEHNTLESHVPGLAELSAERGSQCQEEVRSAGDEHTFKSGTSLRSSQGDVLEVSPPAQRTSHQPGAKREVSIVRQGSEALVDKLDETLDLSGCPPPTTRSGNRQPSSAIQAAAAPVVGTQTRYRAVRAAPAVSNARNASTSTSTLPNANRARPITRPRTPEFAKSKKANPGGRGTEIATQAPGNHSDGSDKMAAVQHAKTVFERPAARARTQETARSKKDAQPHPVGMPAPQWLDRNITGPPTSHAPARNARNGGRPSKAATQKTLPTTNDRDTASATSPTRPFGPKLSSVNRLGHILPISPIPRKASAVVKIPDFPTAQANFQAQQRARKHALGVQVRAAATAPTIPQCGQTPGRTSRARMQERGEWDRANAEYQRKRAEAMKAYLAEKERAEIEAEEEMRKKIAFKAHPVPEWLPKRVKPPAV